MATRYFDYTAGSDITGDGSIGNPWATLEGKFGSTAAGDTLFFRRGTEQRLYTQYRGIRSGISATVPFKMLAYGDGVNPVFSFPSGAGSWGYVLNGSNTSNVVIEDIDFNCETANALKNGGIYIAAQGDSSAVSGWRVRRSRFYNSAGNSGIILTTELNAVNASISDFSFDNCDFFKNGEHGVISVNASKVIYRNCKAWQNGINSAQGGHGFSSRAHRTDVSSGWTLVSGNVYKRGLTSAEAAGGVTYVQSPIPNRLRLVKNTVTPTTPGLDEYGVSSGELFINVGTNPNAYTIRYAWARCWNIVYEDCAAWENHVNSQSTFLEGNGFAFDDFTEDSRTTRCKSFGNEGRGFSSNRGDRNIIEDCVASGNWLSAVGSNTSEDLRIRRSTFVENNKGVPIAAPLGSPGVITGSPNLKNLQVSDCVIVGRGYDIGVEDTMFSTGTTIARCSITNVTAAARNTTPSNSIVGDPLLASNYAPKMGSPLLGAGLHSGYVRDVEGRQRQNPPTVGAFDTVALVNA